MNPNPELDMAALRQGIAFRFPVTLHGKSYKVRPLSIYEEDQIARDVLGEIAEIPEQERSSLAETVRLSIKKLETASTSEPGVYDPCLPSAMLQRLTAAQVDSLLKQWIAGCEKCNPRPEAVPSDKLEAAVADLKKSSAGQETMLTELSFYQLVDICLFLLQKPELPAGNSSG